MSQHPSEFDRMYAAIRKASKRFLSEGAATSTVPLEGGMALCFGKTQGEWCLYVAEPTDRTPLTNCSLSVRILAASKLEELFAAHKAECARLRESISAAIAQYEAFAAEST